MDFGGIRWVEITYSYIISKLFVIIIYILVMNGGLHTHTLNYSSGDASSLVLPELAPMGTGSSSMAPRVPRHEEVFRSLTQGA